MKNFFLGSNPITTIAGYLLAGLHVANDLLTKGITSGWQIAIPVAIAILGRVAGDSTNTK